MIRGILIFGFIVLALNVGWVFASPLINNTMLQGKMEDLSKYRGLKSQGDVEHELMDFIGDKSLPISSENLYLQVTQGETLIAAHYWVDVEFWILHHTYEFTPASSPNALQQLGIQRARNQINAR